MDNLFVITIRKYSGGTRYAHTFAEGWSEAYDKARDFAQDYEFVSDVQYISEEQKKLYPNIYDKYMKVRI